MKRIQDTNTRTHMHTTVYEIQITWHVLRISCQRKKSTKYFNLRAQQRFWNNYAWAPFRQWCVCCIRGAASAISSESSRRSSVPIDGQTVSCGSVSLQWCKIINSLHGELTMSDIASQLVQRCQFELDCIQKSVDTLWVREKQEKWGKKKEEKISEQLKKKQVSLQTSSKKMMPADQISQLAPPSPHCGGA